MELPVTGLPNGKFRLNSLSLYQAKSEPRLPNSQAIADKGEKNDNSKKVVAPRTRKRKAAQENKNERIAENPSGNGGNEIYR